MLWSVVILLATAITVDSYTVHDTHERLAHGRQLKIYLPKSSEKLEFTPADEPGKTFVYWERNRNRVSRGRVSGTGSDRRWYIDKVTYEDQGTYTQRDYWNKEVSTVKVAVIPRRNYLKCVAGASLYISLEGVDLADASLLFSVDNANITLVRDGARVSQDIPDYWDRVQTHSMNIEIKHVNISDEGHYTLRDRKDRVVSITRMDITDVDDSSSGNPLLALLLLLGIPAGICCCCRKKIFKKKPPTGAVLQSSPEAVHPPPSGPVGPCPPYNAPGQPGQPGTMYYHNPNSNMDPAVYPPQPTGPGQWNGPPPSPGFNPAYPPQNTSYGPAAPVMPPGQPQQWPCPPQAQYPPAPMGYSPAVYSAPPEEGVKGVNMASTAADPLLASAPEGEAASSPVAPEPPSSTTVLTTSDNTCKFQIDGEKSSTNFL